MFKCTGCSALTSLNEIEVSTDGEQLCRACAEATGQAGAFEASIEDDPSYQRWLAETARECRGCDHFGRPCGGCQQGSVCDGPCQWCERGEGEDADERGRAR